MSGVLIVSVGFTLFLTFFFLSLSLGLFVVGEGRQAGRLSLLLCFCCCHCQRCLQRCCCSSCRQCPCSSSSSSSRSSGKIVVLVSGATYISIAFSVFPPFLHCRRPRRCCCCCFCHYKSVGVISGPCHTLLPGEYCLAFDLLLACRLVVNNPSSRK